MSTRVQTRQRRARREAKERQLDAIKKSFKPGFLARGINVEIGGRTVALGPGRLLIRMPDDVQRSED